MSARRSSLAFVCLAAATVIVAACGMQPPTGDAGDSGGTIDAPRADTPAIDVQTGERCVNDIDCSDGLYCNGQERCLAGVCAPGSVPCDDRASCTDDTCEEDREAGDHCVRVTHDEMCGDGNACNGTERCMPGSPGTVPGTGCQVVRPDSFIDCDDSNNCTIDTCDPAIGCFHSPRDLDGDGHVDRMCTANGVPGGPPGTDCNDGDPTVFPGSRENCNDGVDNDCNGRTDYADTSAMCVATNGTCAAARVLDRPGTFWGSTVGLMNSQTLSCNTVAARDAIFTFTTTAVQDVRVSMNATDNGAAITVSDTCAPMLVERGCSRAIDGGMFGMSTTPAIFMRSLPAGTYFLIIETPSANAFQFSLRIEAPTTPPPGDSCPPVSPAVDLVSGTPNTLAVGTLGDDFTLSCNAGVPRPDAVYRLVLTGNRNVDMRVMSTSGTNFLSVRQGPCPGGAQLRCISGGTNLLTAFRDLPAGEYFIVVENSASVPVTVTATSTDAALRAPGDACRTATVVPLGASLPTMSTATVDATMLLQGADHGTPCGSGAAPDGWRDAVFTYTVPESSDTNVTVTATGGWSPAFRWAVETTCGVQTSIVGRCQSGLGTTASSARIFGQPAGQYFVVIETNAVPPVGAGFRVDVAATSPASRPTYEACPGAPIALTASGTALVGSRLIDTAVPVLDRTTQHGTACGSGTLSPGAAGWTDAVFSFNIPDRRNVVITFGSSNPPFTFWYIETQRTCGSSGTRVGACTGYGSGGIGSGTAATITLPLLDAGTYYLMAESTAPMPGQVNVAIRATTP